eukprot:765785-Hanusia_phi.AAC.4
MPRARHAFLRLVREMPCHARGEPLACSRTGDQRLTRNFAASSCRMWKRGSTMVRSSWTSYTPLPSAGRLGVTVTEPPVLDGSAIDLAVVWVKRLTDGKGEAAGGWGAIRASPVGRQGEQSRWPGRIGGVVQFLFEVPRRLDSPRVGGSFETNPKKAFTTCSGLRAASLF